MRVLLVSIGYRGYAQHYATALRSRGHSVVSYVGLRQHDVATRTHRLLSVRIPNAFGASRPYTFSEQARLRRFVARHRAPADVALFINSHQLATDELLQSLSSRGCLTALWLLDEVATLTTHDLSLRSFDRVASFSPADCASLAASNGRPCAYVPQAMAPIDVPTPRGLNPRPLMVGAPYPARRAVAAAVEESGCGVDLVSSAWLQHPPRGPDSRVFRDVDLVETLGMSTSARLCLNAHRHRDAGVSPRLFEIGGAGGLIISDNSNATMLFEPGAEMAYWSETGEAVEHVHHALRDTSWRVRLAEAGRRRVMAEHTLERRLGQLLDAWDLSDR